MTADSVFTVAWHQVRAVHAVRRAAGRPSGDQGRGGRRGGRVGVEAGAGEGRGVVETLLREGLGGECGRRGSGGGSHVRYSSCRAFRQATRRWLMTRLRLGFCDVNHF